MQQKVEQKQSSNVAASVQSQHTDCNGELVDYLERLTALAKCGRVTSFMGVGLHENGEDYFRMGTGMLVKVPQLGREAVEYLKQGMSV